MDGVKADPEKLAAVRYWPEPKSLYDLRRFIGFVSYYRCFVKGFARVASPLHKLEG